MKETKLQPEQIEIIQSNNGLKLYLNGLLTGHPATKRSSLYNIEGRTRMLSPDEILDEWLAQLKVLESGSSFEQKVFQFDLAQQAKWGPQGAVAPIRELMDEIVLPSFTSKPRPSAFSTDAWRLAKERVVYKLHGAGARSLRPALYRSVVDDMRARDTLESNSGWPLFTRRNKSEVIAASIRDAESGRWKNYPAIALFRNYNQKTRLVWMFPMSANLVEGSFFQPLQRVLMKSTLANEFLSPWKGFETVRQLVTKTYAAGMSIAASDFSSTDANFLLDTTLEVFDVLQYCFQAKYRASLKESMIHMHTIPLVVSPATQLVGEHGVSSGSNWTNFVETIFDMILAEYVEILENRNFPAPDEINYSGLYAIGDDMSWRTSSYDADFTVRLEEYGKAVGQIIKAEKTTNDPDSVKSLQRLFQRGYFQDNSSLLRAVYSTIRALKSLVFPEKMHKKKLWSRAMNAIRTFMILENTCDHPLFHQFCDFVAAGDPYLRVFARMSAARQAYYLGLSRLIPGLNATYNQERRDKPISEFASIKYLAA